MSIRSRLKRFVLPKVLQALNPHWYQLSYLKRLLQALDIDCVVDVGANAGQFALELRSLGYKGLILSFEPDSTTFKLLRQRASTDDVWRVFNVALGSQRGELEFNIMKRSEFNSFRAPSTSETNIVANLNSVVRRETVQVHTLSDYLPPLAEELGFKRVFLKMDTQGFDWEVFSGSTEVLDFVVGFQSEISVRRIYENVPPWSEMVARYETAGFKLANLFSVSPGMVELLEFDCYMTRPRSAQG